MVWGLGKIERQQGDEREADQAAQADQAVQADHEHSPTLLGGEPSEWDKTIDMA